ncbi:MAG: aromatic ring-hydroxylating dioxygenase subunit alpha [Deltaproteobacteria bacterium]|nr:aromatic ring-hydroxylating dioxygenase subunit alpha [Deltaproteobacteria bacterium]
MAASLRNIIQAYDPKCPLDQASTAPASWYTDARIAELERRTVFSRSWQMAARSDRLIDCGRYVTGDIAGAPVALVRGEDGVLRGFFNVCRHHAAQVLLPPEGCAKHLRCPYHGWTYDLTGRLVAAPEFAGVANFSAAKIALPPVRVASFGRWLFAKLAGEGDELNVYLGGDLRAQIDRLALDKLHWYERRCYTLDCNWKIYVDNYLDGGYHVPHIHTGLNSVLTPGKYRIETGARHCLQSSDMIPSASDGETAAVRQGERASYFWIYPNFMINVYAGVMDTNLVRPLGVDRCEVIFDYYFADLADQGRNRASIALSEKIQDEDKAICESVQRGLRSRSYDAGRLSVRREAGEHLFHRLLHADLTEGVAR